MNGDIESSSKISTFTEIILEIFVGGMVEILFTFFFATSIGALVWVGLWSLLLIIPIGFMIYHLVTKKEPASPNV